MASSTAMAERPTTPTRTRILVEASKLFAENGYHGTSTSDIAAAVGIRQPSLFHHFPAKAAILEELVRAALEPSHALARRLVRAQGSPALRLFRLTRFDAYVLASSPYDLRGVGAASIGAAGFEDWTARYEELLEVGRKLVRAAVRSGEFVDVDPAFAIHAVDHLATVTIETAASGRMADPSRFADDVASFALRALLRDPRQLDRIRNLAPDVTQEVP